MICADNSLRSIILQQRQCWCYVILNKQRSLIRYLEANTRNPWTHFIRLFTKNYNKDGNIRGSGVNLCTQGRSYLGGATCLLNWLHGVRRKSDRKNMPFTVRGIRDKLLYLTSITFEISEAISMGSLLSELKQAPNYASQWHASTKVSQSKAEPIIQKKKSILKHCVLPQLAAEWCVLTDCQYSEIEPCQGQRAHEAEMWL